MNPGLRYVHFQCFSDFTSPFITIFGCNEDKKETNIPEKFGLTRLSLKSVCLPCPDGQY